jgi:hypothetical protein
VTNYFDSGAFLADLTRRIAFRTESQRARPCPDRVPTWTGNGSRSTPAGAIARMLGNPAAGWPFLIAHWHEAGDLPTVLTYGHADVILAQEHCRRSGPGP